MEKMPSGNVDTAFVSNCDHDYNYIAYICAFVYLKCIGNCSWLDQFLVARAASVLELPSNGCTYIPLASRYPAVIHHITGWWVWLGIQLFCVISGGKNGTNGCHLAGFSKDIAFAHHFVATHLPPTLPPYIGVLLVLATPIKAI